MKLRLRTMEEPNGDGAVKTHSVDVDLPPTATLADLKSLVAAKLSAAQTISAESVRISLDRSEELVAPHPTATLPDLGIAPGDLVFFSLPQPAEAPAVDSIIKCWSSFVLRDLKREMENANGAKGTVTGRLVAAVHAALLDAGFVTSNTVGSNLLQDWAAGAPVPLAIKYTIPELSPMLSVGEEGKVAVLNFSLIGSDSLMVVDGYVPGAQSEVHHQLSLEWTKLEPLRYLESDDQLSGVQEREILELWIVLKDEMCLPLLISLCQLNSLRLPPCLMALPPDLKTKVLEFVPGVDLAKVECTCREMRNLAADDSLWKKFVYASGTSANAKARFADEWRRRNRIFIIPFWG